jgi:hypothetical protein
MSVDSSIFGVHLLVGDSSSRKILDAYCSDVPTLKSFLDVRVNYDSVRWTRLFSSSTDPVETEDEEQQDQGYYRCQYDYD